MIKNAVILTQEALRVCGKPLRRARVALLGSIKQGSGAEAFAEALETKGSRLSLYDPAGLRFREDEGRLLKRTLNECVEGTDCVVILNCVDSWKRLSLKKIRVVMKKQAALVDLVGVVEPLKVIEAGFVYRGLGRGAWKK